MRTIFKFPVTLVFFLLCTGVMCLGHYHPDLIEEYFVNYPDDLWSIETWPCMFLYVLGHADFGHFASNMLMFLFCGLISEKFYGSRFLAGVILTNTLTLSLLNSFCETPKIGSSGVGYMVLVMAIAACLKEEDFPQLLYLITFGFVFNEIYPIIPSVTDNVWHLGHIVGLLLGCGFGLIFRLRQKQNITEIASTTTEEVENEGVI